jgi:hypothetical protein
MSLKRRELYSSSNGDRWFLVRNTGTRSVFIRHEANVPSGGQVTDIPIDAFLSGERETPERQALVRLIGTLVESIPDSSSD